MHHLPANGNFCDKHGNDTEPKIIQDYKKHMGYVDWVDRMINNYVIWHWTWKWTLLRHTSSNSVILLTVC